MRIIKEGVLPDKTLTGACRNCSAVVECRSEDGTIRYAEDDNTPYCHCPTKGCGERIWLEKKA